MKYEVRKRERRGRDGRDGRDELLFCDLPCPMPQANKKRFSKK
jgi:hypothetical protein